MVDTRSVSNNQGRSRISFRLCDSLNGLVVISTHGNLCYIYITIAHCNTSQVFLLHFFTAGCKLCYSTGRGSLGSLSACIGIYFGVEYHNVDIFSAGEDMIHTAESDIICPSVTAEYPLGFLGKEVFVFNDILAYAAVLCFQYRYQLIGCRSVGHAAVVGIQVFLACRLNSFVPGIGKYLFNLSFQPASDCVLCKQHTHTELSVIFEQGVVPSGSLAGSVYGIRCTR